MNDERRSKLLNELSKERSHRCPVYPCAEMHPEKHIYHATVLAPDGRQRTVWGCVLHLTLEVAQALSTIRLEPFD